MKAKVLVRVDREAALAALHALDALSAACRDDHPKQWQMLKPSCRQARRGLLNAIGYLADLHGLKLEAE
jgi:hypothetical protein